MTRIFAIAVLVAATVLVLDGVAAELPAVLITAAVVIVVLAVAGVTLIVRELLAVRTWHPAAVTVTVRVEASATPAAERDAVAAATRLALPGPQDGAQRAEGSTR